MSGICPAGQSSQLLPATLGIFPSGQSSHKSPAGLEKDLWGQISQVSPAIFLCLSVGKQYMRVTRLKHSKSLAVLKKSLVVCKILDLATLLFYWVALRRFCMSPAEFGISPAEQASQSSPLELGILPTSQALPSLFGTSYPACLTASLLIITVTL